MRLSLLTAAVLLAFAGPASAQTVGVEAGLTVANFTGDDAVGSEARLGFTGGVTASLPLAPLVEAEVGVFYAQKGEEYLNTVGSTETTRLDYLELPATLRLRVPAGPGLDLGLSAGGYVGVPLSGEVEVDGSFSSDLDLNTDAGGIVGLDVGAGPFYAEARYVFGLTNAIEYDPGIDAFDLEKKNQVVALTFGYRFGGGQPRY